MDFPSDEASFFDFRQKYLFDIGNIPYINMGHRDNCYFSSNLL